MKFISIVTGAILEPKSEMVEEQLRKNPNFAEYCEEENHGGEKSLEKMSKAELLEFSEKAGINVSAGATKAEILSILKSSYEE